MEFLLKKKEIFDIYYEKKTIFLTLLLKSVYRLNIIPIKIPKSFFYRNKKINPKIHTEAQKTLNSLSNPKQKEQCWKYHNT
jgi:hypothetical protein